MTMPALGGGDIHQALVGRDRFGDPAAAEQPGALIGDCRLSWRNAKFGTGEADPIAIQSRRNRRCERANLDADFTVLLAEPVPAADPHRLNRQRAPRPDDDAPLLGLDPNDVERLLLA